MENLKKALSFGGILGADEIDEIVSHFKIRHLKPGGYFFEVGEICDRLAFIDEGVLRIYISDGDVTEATRYFMRRNQFMMDVESFYNNTPADAGIQAVMECRLLVIDRSAWQRISERFPKLFILAKSLTEAALMNKIKDNDFLYFGTASQKYSEFVRRYPDLALSVPQQYIASYLQITPQSLSRIRKGTAKQ